eukprot:361323-Chlamydomonas_euryale.AAC.12
MSVQLPTRGVPGTTPAATAAAAAAAAAVASAVCAELAREDCVLLSAERWSSELLGSNRRRMLVFRLALGLKRLLRALSTATLSSCTYRSASLLACPAVPSAKTDGLRLLGCAFSDGTSSAGMAASFADAAAASYEALTHTLLKPATVPVCRVCACVCVCVLIGTRQRSRRPKPAVTERT